MKEEPKATHRPYRSNPMNKFTQAALSAAASLALFGGALTLITSAPANAGMNCTTNSFTGSTNCYGSGGSFNSTYNDFTGTSTYRGTDSNGNSYSGSCTYNDFTGSTSCY